MVIEQRSGRCKGSDDLLKIFCPFRDMLDRLAPRFWITSKVLAKLSFSWWLVIQLEISCRQTEVRTKPMCQRGERVKKKKSSCDTWKHRQKMSTDHGQNCSIDCMIVTNVPDDRWISSVLYVYYPCQENGVSSCHQGLYWAMRCTNSELKHLLLIDCHTWYLRCLLNEQTVCNFSKRFGKIPQSVSADLSIALSLCVLANFQLKDILLFIVSCVELFLNCVVSLLFVFLSIANMM